MWCIILSYIQTIVNKQDMLNVEITDGRHKYENKDTDNRKNKHKASFTARWCLSRKQSYIPFPVAQV